MRVEQHNRSRSSLAQPNGDRCKPFRAERRFPPFWCAGCLRTTADLFALPERTTQSERPDSHHLTSTSPAELSTRQHERNNWHIRDADQFRSAVNQLQ